MQAGWVYFIGAPAVGVIKIGFSGKHPNVRFRRLSATSPAPLVPLGTLRGSLATEWAIQRRFRGHWSHGEWFRADEGLRAFIAGRAEPWEVPPRKFVRKTSWIAAPAERAPEPAREFAEGDVVCWRPDRPLDRRDPGRSRAFRATVQGRLGRSVVIDVAFPAGARYGHPMRYAGPEQLSPWIP